MQSQSNTSILPKISPVSENILSNGSVGAPLESQEPSGFDKFSLSPKLKQALRRLSFNNPTDIQSQAIPFALTQRDIIASAQTGTGKTAAFSIPMITKLEQNPKLSALILVPTREIAAQIANVLKDLTFALPELRSALLIGGAAMPTLPPSHIPLRGAIISIQRVTFSLLKSSDETKSAQILS